MKVLIGLVSGLFMCMLVSAQSAPSQRVYLPNIADEDWRFLKDPSKHVDFWDRVKYIPLGRNDWSVGFGGEIRYRAQGFNVQERQGEPDIKDNYLLQRYLLGADVRKGDRFRVFVELQSGLISGKLTSPRPTDKNLLDLHQAFVEFRSAETARGQVELRIGRQELAIGSSRLIAAAQGLNVKRSFDGGSIAYTRNKWVAAAGVARLVKLREGIFDDPPDPAQDFWGVALARNQFPLTSSVTGGYYLGVDREYAQYVQGNGPERRHTVGARISGTKGNLNFTYDLIHQWGDFHGTRIRSWAFATLTGYRLGKAGLWRPKLVLSVNSAAGDKDPNDNSLESFNPLFPSNAYSGLVGLFGPTNLTDFTPGIQVPVRTNLLIAAESPFYRRTSSRDGVYGIDLRPLISGLSTNARYLGTNPGVIVSWQPVRHMSLSGAVTRFLPGSFLNDSFLENGFFFYSIALTYRI